MKRLIMLVTAILLACFTLAGPAVAGDEPAAEGETATVVEPKADPAPEPEPEVQAPAPEPEVKAPAPAKVEKIKPPVEETTTPEKPWICHPVNGKGETGNGWNLINPNHASSHIDDQGNPKHTSNDGRVDTPAVNGECPGSPPEECPEVSAKTGGGDECEPETPVKPEPVVKSKVKEKCVDPETVKVVTVTKTWDWTLVDNVWVKDAEPTKDKAVDYRPAKDGECDEPAPPFKKWTVGEPVCDGLLYPYDKPESDEFWIYRVDDKGDDSRTLVFTVEDRQTGEIVFTDEHTFKAPTGCDKTDEPDEPDALLPNTGGPSAWLLLIGGVLMASGVGVVSAVRLRKQD